ncbi:MAG: DUF6675 family protein [Treponema sp.]|nr:DUF6675 family protein [Treponema sp.]
MKIKMINLLVHRKPILCLCLAILLIGGIFAQTAENIPSEIDGEIFQQMLEKGEYRTQSFKERGKDFTLYPRTELGYLLTKTWTEEKEPVFVAESLFLIEKPEGSNQSELDTALISRIMRSISSMEGIEYYSNSEKKMKTLYSQSYTIDSLEDKNRIPDKVDGSAENLSVYAFQEDGSFGDNCYQIDYHQRENEVSMVIRLMEPLKYGLITAVKANNLVFNIDVLDKGSYLVMYVGAKVKFPAISLLENKLNKSFGSRITALHDWFSSSYISAKEAELK